MTKPQVSNSERRRGISHLVGHGALGLLGTLCCWALTILLVGCGSEPATSKSGEESKSLYHEGKGLKLSEETRKSLGLQTAAAAPRAIHRQFVVTAQVFERNTNEAGAIRVLASAFVPASTSRTTDRTQVIVRSPGSSNASVTGLVVRADNSTRSAFGQAEVVIECPDTGGYFPLGSSFEARLDAGIVQAAVAVPRAALVRAGLGDFLYVAEGEFLKRALVKIGVEDADWAEILDGLPTGKSVVTHGAESLWLLELSEVGGMVNIK